jgi:transcriptional regulator with XRE-family HTH domain
MFKYYQQQIGYLVSTERAKQGLTYYQLQKQSKVAANVIKSIEKGTTNYTLESLVRVCEALRIGINICKK